MDKLPSDNHYHYTRTTLVQKAFYAGIGITAALAIHSCSPNTFNKMSYAYKSAETKAVELKDRVIREVVK